MNQLEEEILDAIKRYEKSTGMKVSCQLSFTSMYNVVSATKLNEEGTQFVPGIYKSYRDGVKGFKTRHGMCSRQAL